MLKRHAFRGFAGLLLAGAVVHVATLWPRVQALGGVLGPHSWVIVAAFVLSALTALAACGLAGLLLWKAADRPAGRALTLFLGFLAVFWGSVFRFLEVGAAERTVELNVSYGSGWVSQSALIAFLLASAAFLRFSAVFPTPLTAGDLPPLRFPRFGPSRWLRRVRVAFLSPLVVWGSAVATYLIQRFVPEVLVLFFEPEPGAEPAMPALALAGFLVAILLMAAYAVFAMALGARNLRDGYRRAAPGERGPVLWVAAGFSLAWWLILGAAGSVALGAALDDGMVVLSAAVPVALLLAPLVAVSGAAIGVLYSGAIDPALALERSTVYGALGVLGLLTFAALENALSELVEQWVRLPGFVGTMAAGAIVAAALFPLRGLLRRWVRRPGSGSASDGEARTP